MQEKNLVDELVPLYCPKSTHYNEVASLYLTDSDTAIKQVPLPRYITMTTARVRHSSAPHSNRATHSSYWPHATLPHAHQTAISLPRDWRSQRLNLQQRGSCDLPRTVHHHGVLLLRLRRACGHVRAQSALRRRFRPTSGPPSPQTRSREGYFRRQVCILCTLCILGILYTSSRTRRPRNALHMCR